MATGKSDDINYGREAAEGVKDAVQETIIGKDEWKRSKLGYLFGFSALTRNVGGVADRGRKSFWRWSFFKTGAFRHDDQGVAIEEEVTDAHLRFRAAMDANGRTLTEINRSVDNTYRQFWLFATLFVLAFAWGVGSLIGTGLGSGIFMITDILFRFALLPILTALILRAGFTNWLFRRRRLDGLGDYLRSGELLPKKAPPAPASVPAKVKKTSNTPRSAAVLMILLGAALLLAAFPDIALAQQQTVNPNDIFQTKSQPDLFMRLLAYVIPDAGPVGTPDIGIQGWHSAVKNGFMAFCGTLLFIGSAMAGWHITTGLVASAREGKALGSNYHEVWAPMRVVVGYGMLVPAMKGLCAAQILVLYLISWGGNLANLVWSPYIDTITVGTIPSMQQQVQDTVKMGNAANATAAVKAVFEKTLCAEVVNLGNTRLGVQNAQISVPPSWKTISNPNYSMWSSQSVPKNIQTLDYGPVCGMISLEVLAVSLNTPEISNTKAMLEAKKQAITEIANNSELKSLAQRAAQTYYTNQGSGEQSSRAFSSESNPDQYASLFTQAINTYVSAVSNAVGQAMQSSDPNTANEITQLREQAKKDGWAAAGVYYLTLARIQARVYAAATEGLQIGGVTGTRTNGQSAFITDALVGTKESPGALTQFGDWWDTKNRQITNSAMGTASQAASETNSNALSWVLNELFGGFANWFNSRSDSTQVIINPMADTITYGNKLLVGAQTAIVSGALLSGGIEAGNSSILGRAVNGIAGIGAGLKGVFGFLSPFVTMLTIAILAAGAIQAFVIPMIPYIMSVFFVVGMMTLVVEGLAAAPLWAFFHIRMDGQEFVDHVQRPGYMIAFNLILRPVLMIFGVILSYIVFGTMLWFVNTTFIPASNALSQSSSIGFIGMFVMIVLMSYLDFQIAVRSFQLITHIPERVSRWFGQGGDNLGDDHDSQQATRVFVGGMEHRVSTMATGVGNAKMMKGAGQGSSLSPKGGGGREKPQIQGQQPAKG